VGDTGKKKTRKRPEGAFYAIKGGEQAELKQPVSGDRLNFWRSSSEGHEGKNREAKRRGGPLKTHGAIKRKIMDTQPMRREE